MKKRKKKEKVSGYHLNRGTCAFFLATALEVFLVGEKVAVALYSQKPWHRLLISLVGKFSPVSSIFSLISYNKIDFLFLKAVLVWREEVDVRRQNKGPPFKFLAPLVYAPILPLSTSSLLSSSSLHLFIQFFFLGFALYTDFLIVGGS